MNSKDYNHIARKLKNRADNIILPDRGEKSEFLRSCHNHTVEEVISLIQDLNDNFNVSKFKKASGYFNEL